MHATPLLLIPTLCLVCLAGCSDGAVEPAPRPVRIVKVLWIGNSYTVNPRIPGTIDAMTAESDLPFRTESEMSVSGGKDWRWHFEDPASRAVPMLTTGDYDYVVLQNQSSGAAHERDEMVEYGRRFAALAREHGTQVVVYCTWPRRHDKVFTGSVESDWETIRAAHEEVAAEEGAVMAPVGHAWVAAIAARPDLALYAEDGSHPSAAGGYLAACVFYAVFTDQSPVGLSTRGSWHEAPQGGMAVNAEDAELLEQIAWQAYESAAAASEAPAEPE